MSIPFAIHRSGSAVPVGRLRGLHSGCALGLVPASGDLLRFARGLSVFRTDVRRLGVREGVEGAHGNGRIKLPSQARSWVPDPPELLAVRMGGTTSAPAMFEESGRRESNPRSQLGKPIELLFATCGYLDNAR